MCKCAFEDLDVVTAEGLCTVYVPQSLVTVQDMIDFAQAIQPTSGNE